MIEFFVIGSERERSALVFDPDIFNCMIVIIAEQKAIEFVDGLGVEDLWVLRGLHCCYWVD